MAVILVAKPNFITLKGWNCDISKCKTLADLPKEAVEYVHFLEHAVECPVKYISVGARRDAIIVL